MRTRALGIALGVAADAVLGDPTQHHPVAWFGTWASAVERRTYADDTARGAAFTTAAVAPVIALGVIAERATRRHAVLHVAATAVATWAVLGARSLSQEGEAMADHLDADDLAAARERITHLCGRDPEQLDEPELARAAVESMAENTAENVPKGMPSSHLPSLASPTCSAPLGILNWPLLAQLWLAHPAQVAHAPCFTQCIHSTMTQYTNMSLRPRLCCQHRHQSLRTARPA